MSSATKSGSTNYNLKDIVENWDVQSIKALDQETLYLLSVYRQWERSARDPCGHLFVHQAYKRPSDHKPELSSTTAM